MKKIINLLIILFCVVTLSGCGSKETINTKRTIVLNVDSEVVPTFTSNFGSGTYDRLNKTYTHTIDYVKDLYIYLDYENLKTLTVHIPTNDMNEETITKDVTFGALLDVEVEVTVEGVKKLEGLELSDNLKYSNLNIGNKNSFKFTLPSREESYNIKFTLPGYREFNIDLDEKDLISGIANVNTVAVTTEQMFIGFNGNQYSYEIYSMTTNKLISSGSEWSNNIDTKYVLLPNDDNYYVQTRDGNYVTELHKVNNGEDTIIKLETSRNNYSNMYLTISEENATWYSYMLYDKTSKNLRYYSSQIIESLENTGLLVKNYENKWFYMDSLATKVTKEENGYNYKYVLNYDDFEEISFNVKRIHTETNQIISSQIETSVYLNKDTHAEFEDNVFTLTIYEIPYGVANIDLYADNNQKIRTIQKDINSYFKGEIVSGTITYNERTIPYQFPMFLEDLVFDGTNYSYPNQIINIDVSYVKIQFVDESGYFRDLYYNDNPYIMDEEYNVIMGKNIDGIAYFELEANKNYTLHYYQKTYSFKTTKANIETGKVTIIHEKAPIINVKIPNGYTLELNGYEAFDLTPNEEGLVTIPAATHTGIYGELSNGFATRNISFVIEKDVSEYEFEPFYVLNGGMIESDYENYYIGTYEGSNGMKYVVIDKLYESTIDELETNIRKYIANGSYYENYKININNFVYNETLKAYYYDLENEFDHSVVFDNNVLSWSNWLQDYYYYDDSNGNRRGYVNNGTTIECGGNSYTISSNDAKHINISLNMDSYPYLIEVTPTNN